VKLNDSTLKVLERLVVKLRKYCHDQSCEDIEVCPLKCCRDGENDPMLDLDTSIAWSAADLIERLIFDKRKRVVKELSYGLLILERVVEPHKKRYFTLHKYLLEALCLIDNEALGFCVIREEK